MHLIGILFVVAVGIGFITYTPPVKRVEVKRSKPKAQPKPKKQKDPLFDEAKKMLVSMGYTATEAKSLLQDVSGSTAQDYINQAMQKVEI